LLRLEPGQVSLFLPSLNSYSIVLHLIYNTSQSFTGIVPCTSLLKEHVRKMLMLEPETYLAGLSENEKRSVKVLSAQEAKDGTLYHNLTSSMKGCLSTKKDVDDDRTTSLALSSLTSSGQQQSILASMMAVNVSSQGHGGAARFGLKLAIFAATRYMCKSLIYKFDHLHNHSLTISY